MKYFNGRHNGYSVRDLFQMLDYSKNKLDDRMKIVDKIISTGFFEKFFDESYDPIKNKNDFLSEEDNVCLLLETMGTYILNSEELKDNDGIYNSREMKKKFNKDESIESIAGHLNKDNIVHNMKVNKVGAIAENKSFKISSMKDEEFKYQYNLLDKCDQEVVDSYVDYFKYIDKKKLNKRQKDMIKFRIKQDIETVLEGLRQVKHSNIETQNDSYYEKDKIRLEDLCFRHVLTGVSYQKGHNISRSDGLLFVDIDINEGIDSELYEIKKTIDRAVTRANLTNKEEKILKMTRKGFKTEEIATKLNIAIGSVTYSRARIVDKVLKETRDIILNKEV